jgi:propionate CoA-transferase
VEHRTFSGANAWKRSQPALYVTERAVFELGVDGLELVEIAPGIDLERDVLAQMDFRPSIRGTPRLMEAAIFRDGPMGLRERMLAIPMERRLSYDPELDILFINFERLRVRSAGDVESIRHEVEKRVAPLGKRVYAVVNYEGFEIGPEVLDAWGEMVKHLVDRYYWGVTRYTTSAFLRMKLGDALERRGVAPHIYESGDEAREHVKQLGR